MSFRSSSKPVGILDRTVTRGKGEINISTFALLFSEMVQYSQSRVTTISDLQNRISDFGKFVGSRLLDLIVFREKGYKRETKLLNMLMFVKSTLWKNIFGKEADKLERNSENAAIYYIIEREPLVNTFISVPKDKVVSDFWRFYGLSLSMLSDLVPLPPVAGSLNCAAFTAGIIDAVLNASNFPCTVNAVWHNGTTYYMIEFDESVINREKQFGN